MTFTKSLMFCGAPLTTGVAAAQDRHQPRLPVKASERKNLIVKTCIHVPCVGV